MANKTIAIYGGTFDPIHSAHLEIIETLSRDFDKVIIIPTTIRYYKNNSGMFSFNERFENVKKKVADMENVIVSDIERFVDIDWRFIDTLKSIKKLYGKADYIVAMGADSFIKFPTWAQYEEITKMASIVVFGRPGCRIQDFPPISYLRYYDMSNNASSTEIRKKLSTLLNDTDFDDFMSDIGFSLDKNGEPVSLANVEDNID